MPCSPASSPTQSARGQQMTARGAMPALALECTVQNPRHKGLQLERWRRDVGFGPYPLRCRPRLPRPSRCWSPVPPYSSSSSPGSHVIVAVHELPLINVFPQVVVSPSLKILTGSSAAHLRDVRKRYLQVCQIDQGGREPTGRFSRPTAFCQTQNSRRTRESDTSLAYRAKKQQTAQDKDDSFLPDFHVWHLPLQLSILARRTYIPDWSFQCQNLAG